ncbi:hypothetical protein JCM11251_000715 [Rhodosporidiobolus azoricus]
MGSVWRGYLWLLRNYTLPTQMGTAGVTSSAGDLLYQLGFQGRGLDQVEWYKTQRLAFYGTFIWAPIANRWHWVLSRINFESKIKTVLARTATDLTFFSPFATILFYNGQGLMEGRPFRTPAPIAGQEEDEPVQGIYERLEERLWPTVQKQWALFGPANLINLSVVPVYARPPFMNVVSISWNCFLASAAQRGGIPPPGYKLPEGRTVTDREIAIAATEVME